METLKQYNPFYDGPEYEFVNPLAFTAERLDPITTLGISNA
jgi:hypothetical protein